jgi:hypothetical protein
MSGLRDRPAPAPRPPARDTRNAVLVMLTLGLLVFSDCVFRGGMLYQRDLSVFFAGWAEAFARCVADGSWPLWNPHPTFGQPMLATALAQVLYPTTWLNLVVQFPIQMTVSAVLHLAIAGVGVWALLRGLGGSQLAALAGGIAWAASGPFLSSASMPNMYVAAAWLPWVLHLAHRTLGRQRLRDAVLWGAGLAAMVFAGSPDLAVMAVMAVPALAGDADLVAAVRRRPWRALTVAALAGALALALSAIQSLPTLELARTSMRADLQESWRTFWSNHPFIVAQAVLPLTFDPLPLAREWRALLFEGREPFLSSIYMGGPLLALATAGALASRSRMRWSFLLLAALGLLLSFGRHTPVYSLAVEALPVLKAFRYPSKFVVLTGAGLAALAGLGIDAWRDPRAGTRSLWLVAIAAPQVALSASALYLSRPGAVWRALLDPTFADRYPTIVAFGAVCSHLKLAAALTAVVAVVAGVRAWRPRRGAAGAASVALVALLDLVVHTRALNPVVPREAGRYRPAIVEGVAHRRPNRTLVLDYADRRLSSLVLGRPVGIAWPIDSGSVLQFAMQREYPVTIGSGSWGIEGFPSDVPMVNTKDAMLAVYALKTTVPSARYGRVLRTFGVDYVVSLHEGGLAGPLELVARHVSPFIQGEARLWRVRDPLPRAYWVGRASTGDLNELLHRVLEDPGFEPRREVVLDGEGPGARLSSSPSGGGSGEARIVALGPDRLAVETAADTDGYLVVTESWAPGWRAEVDAHAAPVLKANGVFRAVRVPAGRHRVDMTYRPLSVTVGLGISFVGFLAAAVAWRLGRRDRADDVATASPAELRA